MSTTCDIALDYPAGTDLVWTMWLDDAFLEAKGSNTAESAHSIAVDGATTTLTITRLIVDGIPPIAKTFLGDTIALQEVQEWGEPDQAGVRRAHVDLTVKNAPATVTGSITLSPTKSGTRVAIHFDIKVAVPLFGATAESVIKSQLENFIGAEHGIGLKWLASHQ
jgi:hypothetical protein